MYKSGLAQEIVALSNRRFGELSFANIRLRLQGLIFWLSVGMVLLSALGLGANRPVFWLALAAASFVLLFLQFGLDLFDSDAPRLWYRIFPAAFLYFSVVIWAMFQALPAPFESWVHPAWKGVEFGQMSISADPGATWQGVIRLLTYASLFWIACRGGRDADRAQRFVGVVALWSIGLAIYGLGALSFGFNPIVGEPAYPDVVTASFVNRNAYALYAGIGVLACLSAIMMSLPRRERSSPARLLAVRDFLEAQIGGGWVYLVGLIVVTTALLSTESRAGTAAAFIGILTFMAISGAIKGIGLRSLMLVIIGISLIAISLGAGGLGERFLFNDPLEDSRFTVYRQTLVGIGAAPWLGHGLGAFQDAFRPFMAAEISDSEWDFAHSTYLENAFELGLPAALAMVASLALIAWQTMIGCLSRRRMRPVAAFAFAVVIAGGLHSIVDFSLQMPATAALFATILGVGWVQSHRKL
jgi:O-antigen ligase